MNIINRRTRLIQILLFFSMLIPTAVFASENISPDDDFSSNRIDENRWEVSKSSAGIVEARDGKLWITAGPTYIKPFYMVGLKSRWLLSGDFDIEAGFKIVKWSSNSRIRVGLCVKRREDRHPHKQGGCVERVGKVKTWGGKRDVYLTHFKDGVSGLIDTKDKHVRLRLIRAKNHMTGLYFDGEGWKELHKGVVSTEPFEVGLGIWGHYSNPGVEVIFNYFKVNKGKIQWNSQ